MPASLLTVTPLTASGISHVFNNIPQPGVILWLDASKIAGISSGASLSVWTDSSASASHATQPSATSQPVFKTNIQNGLSAVSFNGVGEYLVSATSFSPNNTVAVTWLSARTDLDQTIINPGVVCSAGAGKFSGYDGVSLPGSVATSNVWMTGITIIGSGSSSTFALSGVTFFGNMGSTTNTLTKIGILTAPSSQSFSGLIGEVIVYNRVLPESERVSLETYLRTKWGTL